MTTTPKDADRAALAPTVEQAIAVLVSALAESKGWLRSYADAVIRDAIYRRATRQEWKTLAETALRTAERGPRLDAAIDRLTAAQLPNSLQGDPARLSAQAPAARTAGPQPLTRARIRELARAQWGDEADYLCLAEIEFARAIEAAHGIGEKP